MMAREGLPLRVAPRRDSRVQIVEIAMPSCLEPPVFLQVS